MFASVTYGGRPYSDAVGTGDLRVTGDQEAAQRFLALYTLPPTVEVQPSAASRAS